MHSLKKLSLKKSGPKVLGLFFVTVLAFFSLWLFWATRPAAPPGAVYQTFTIERGAGLSLAARKLEAEGLVRSWLAFRLVAQAKGYADKVQAGDFRLSPSMSPAEVAEALTHGVADRWVTLLEGWRREEMAAELNQKLSGPDGRFDAQEFLDLTAPLEGRLFPDTYLIPRDASASAVVAVLRDNFEAKAGEVSFQDLILASIVEREARDAADRPLVAGILLKRLENDWPLQADATVQYAVGSQNCLLMVMACQEWWPKTLTKEDLKIDSAYNSYLYRGLPPAPIANPGLASIRAAQSPTETEYWFYLSDREGRMHYAQTAEEHNANIARYLK